MPSRRHHARLTFALLAAVLPSVTATPPLEAADAAVDFTRDVAPILQQHCLRCHTPGNAKGEISLATIDHLQQNGYVVAGDPDASYLVELIAGVDDQRPAMPNEAEPLSAAEVATIRRWIAEGATWPAGLQLHEASKADASWWSLQPLAVAATPPADEIPEHGVRNPIDRWVFAALNEADLLPNAPADRGTLIRRATYDLTGLPPTPEQVAAFVDDPDPWAYEKLIDRLLASPHYGQRWARHWLDVVRFGESNGFERNVIINDLWPFRDYVIASLNADKPFDQVIREHLAGDIIGAGNRDIEIGSAFLVAGPYDDVGNQDVVQAAQIRADTIDEMIRAASEAFLGLTVGCARCHDHKFDPILQRDYYRLYATFAGVRHGSRVLASAEEVAAHAARLQPLQQRQASLTEQRRAITTSGGQMALAELDRQVADLHRQIAAVPPLPTAWVGKRVAADAQGPFHIFLGGSPQRKGDTVVPASLSVLQNAAPEYALPPDAAESQRRQALADWIVHPENPLTPRVLANRLWHYHFGTGIVDTPSDFGYMGGRPTHPQLLDWLASQLQRHQWRLKPMHRLIMTSQAYRQSSRYREQAAKVDGDTRLLWRFPPRRLTAEELRDTLLKISGELDTTMGGPGFRLYQFTQDNVCTYVPLDQHGPDTYRRAIYHQNARASVVDLLTDFDQPDCAFSTPRRSETTTPLQALTLMNHSFAIEMASSLAGRLRHEAGEDAASQIRRAYQLCYARLPGHDEASACADLAQQHGLAALCRVLLNTSELMYVQ